MPTRSSVMGRNICEVIKSHQPGDFFSSSSSSIKFLKEPAQPFPIAFTMEFPKNLIPWPMEVLLSFCSQIIKDCGLLLLVNKCQVRRSIQQTCIHFSK